MAVVLAFLNAAAMMAANHPVAVEPGWTPSAFMGLITNLIMGGGVAGGLKIFATHLLQMRKIADARATQVDQRGDAQNAALSTRVTELERAAVEREKMAVEERASMDKALSDERRDCERRINDLQTEIREMRKQFDGLVRKVITYQSAEVRDRQLTPEMQRAVDSLDKIKGVGE